MDGVGEWTTTSAAIGRGNEIKVHKELFFPHSLGLLYSAVTYYIGFKVNSGEYKVMGLAPYGRPVYKDLMIEKLMDLKEDGSFRLNMDYFNYCTGLTMTNERFSKLFGRPVRGREDELLEQFHMDMAASVQAVTEEIVTRLVQEPDGGDRPEERLLGGWCGPQLRRQRQAGARGDRREPLGAARGRRCGGALGAALLAYHLYQGQPRTVDPDKLDGMHGSYLGPAYDNEVTRRSCGRPAPNSKSSRAEELIEKAASLLAAERVVGWCQGRMEFGPRALGARSILGDPRSEKMQKTMNLKIKYRESFRPFAPSVLREDVGRYFETDMDSPYMLLVDQVKPDICRQMSEEEASLFGIEKLNVARSELPAITHVDYSRACADRPQGNESALLPPDREVQREDRVSALINTSFNVRGEPPVCTPVDAFKCFMGTEMDNLVVGNCLLHREAQDPSLRVDYKSAFELD
jgi:carbamoyltransferase